LSAQVRESRGSVANGILPRMLEDISSIIYPAPDMHCVAIQVAGIWWAPVNLRVNMSYGLSSHPGNKNPCPSGWSLPALSDFQALASLVRTSKAVFDNEHKMLKIISDDGTAELSFPAEGYVSINRQLRERGLTGAYWAKPSDSKRSSGLAERMFFQGSYMEAGASDTKLRMSIRCVREKKILEKSSVWNDN